MSVSDRGAAVCDSANHGDAEMFSDLPGGYHVTAIVSAEARWVAVAGLRQLMESTMRTKTMAAIACLGGFAALFSAAATAGAKEDANKKIVLEFYEKGLNQKDADAAAKYFGARYTQHNPLAQDGPEGFKRFIQFLKQKYPASHSEIKHAYADGDYVILHVHAVREPGTRGNAIVDIFKLEDGGIVEHWDVIQEIPEKTANPNGMF
jgi:predicted SnoaL-like aldol condensation-catalyzing enzyme